MHKVGRHNVQQLCITHTGVVSSGRGERDHAGWLCRLLTMLAVLDIL